MSKPIKPILIILSILVVAGVVYFVLSFKISNNKMTTYNKDMKSEEETLIIKEKETSTFGDLSITNNGGGHKILIEGGDLAYTDITLKTNEKEEPIMVYNPQKGKTDKKLWE